MFSHWWIVGRKPTTPPTEEEKRKQEELRREKIRTEEPEIDRLVREREELIFGTLRNILNGGAETGTLPVLSLG